MDFSTLLPARSVAIIITMSSCFDVTSNDTEKNAPVLTPNELKRLGDGKINISAFSVKNGVTSSTSTSSFTLDTVDPTFDQQQPTTVDILSNTPITTTIYDAPVYFPPYLSLNNRWIQVIVITTTTTSRISWL
jgi:hypothetical protein